MHSKTFLLPLNGREIFVRIMGVNNAPVLVLLHHGLGASLSWKTQFEDFLSAGYQIVAYDRWGYGRSSSRTILDVPEFNADIEDLKALITYLNAQHVCVIGHSDGGTIGLEFAARYPELVQALVLVAAHIYVEPKMGHGIEAVRQSFEINERFRLALKELHGRNFPRVFWNWYKAWYEQAPLNWDMRPKIAKINLPCLVIQGAEDEHATLQHAYDLAGAMQLAEVQIIPGARHLFPSENPEAFNHRVIEFLRRITRGDFIVPLHDDLE